MMDEPQEPRRHRSFVLMELAKEDLDLYGVGELQERIDALEAEIGRAQAALDKKRSGRAAADAFFSLPRSAPGRA